MTATMVPQEDTLPHLDPLRLLPIAANLLPPEVTEARRGKKVRVVVAGVIAVAVVATGGWYYEAKQQTSSAQNNLSAAQASNTTLLHQQNGYSGLVKVQSASRALSAQLTNLMAQDLQWWQLIPAIRAAAPAGVSIVAVSGALDQTNGSTAAAPEALPGITSNTEIGLITLTGAAPDKATIAAYVDALGKVPGLANPYITNASIQSGSGYQFNIQIEITSALLSGRFTPKAGAH